MACEAKKNPVQPVQDCQQSVDNLGCHVKSQMNYSEKKTLNNKSSSLRGHPESIYKVSFADN